MIEEAVQIASSGASSWAHHGSGLGTHYEAGVYVGDRRGLGSGSTLASVRYRETCLAGLPCRVHSRPAAPS